MLLVLDITNNENVTLMTNRISKENLSITISIGDFIAYRLKVKDWQAI
jgi:hypothetical protein